MDDFEGNGNITWAADGDTGMDIAFANPSVSGINTSATVLEYSDTGQQYANINFDLSTDTSVKYDLSTKNVFTLKVYVPTPDVAVVSEKTLALKLQDHSSNTPWEGQQAVSVAYEYDVWQELTFDFSAQSAATNFSRIVVQFNGENNFEAVKAYIDDLSYGEAAVAVIDPMDDFEGNGNITWAADGDTGMDIAFANPSVSGINTSATVLEYSDTGQQYANINFDLSTDTSVKYDLSTKNVFTLKVYVPTPDVAVVSEKTLALKLQDHSSNTPWEGQQAVSVAYEYDVWQELTFDFSAQSAATNFSRIVVQFNGENNFEAVKAYIDDLSYGEAAVAVIDPMDDFEGNGNITWAADGDTGMDIAFANPSVSGINTSATVLEYSDTGQQYANINFDLSTDTSVKYDLSTKNVFTLKVYVPTPDVAVVSEKTLALKLQDHSSNTPWEGQQAVSVAYEYDVWQELTFDFSAQSAATNFSRIVVQFNGENNFEAVKAYIDDLSYGEAAVAVIDPMDDFEGNGNITWAADGDTGMDIAFANPSVSGINTSATVLEYSDTGQQYANINFDLSTDTSVKYDLSTKNVFTLKVYVPTPDVAVVSEKTLALKLQDHSSNTPWEGQQAVSVAYEYDVWQELTFDFSAQSAATNFSRIVVQFNGENNFEAVKAYIDDLSYGEAAVAVIDPMDDFEGNGNITWAADGDTGMDIAFANPSVSGINTSATVLEYSDTGQQYANINFDLSTDTSVKYDLSTKNVFTLKVYVPTPDVAVVSEKTLALKLQDHSSNTPWEGQQAVSVAYEYDVWQELTFDFSAQSAATNFSRIVVQFNGENNFEAVKAYIDDLSYGEAATASTTDNALLNISMYPNPASSRLTISAPKTINSAAIYNILGKQVMSLEINKNSESIDVSNLATGMYLIKYSIDNAVGTAKFIKQ